MANKPAQQILHGLLVRGFSQPQAAALAGNIQQESSFNPAAYNKSSNAQGLMQWRLDRATGLANYARDTGRSAQDVDTQLDYIVHEMQGPEAKNVKDFLTAQDVQSANAALKKYIRYGDTETGNRLGYAQAFADAPAPASSNALTAANTEAGGQSSNPLFVNPAFPNAQGPVAPDAASQPAAQPVAQPAAPAPQPAPANDDDILKAWLPADASPTDASTTGTSTAPGQPASSADDDILKQFLPAGTDAAPPSNIVMDYVKEHGIPGQGGLAFAASAINAVPVAGPAITNGLTSLRNNLAGGMNSLMPGSAPTPEAMDFMTNAAVQGSPLAATAGKIFGTVAPVAALGATELGGSLLGTAGNLLTRTVAGGLSSAGIEGADTLARGGTPEQAGKNALTAGVVGGLAAPVGALAGAGLNRLLGSGTSAPVADLAELARNKYNIPVGPGQITTNPAMRMADSVVNRLPLSGGTVSREAQLGAFNRAVSKTFGENSDTLTPDIMAQAKTRLGAVFDSVAARTPTITADATFDQHMLDAMDGAQQTLTDAEIKPLANQFDAILGKFQQGGNSIDGTTYQALTRKGAPLDRALQSDNPNIRYVASQMRDALDDALERSAPADVLADLRQARAQYKALKTVEPIVAKATTGTISPALLAGAVRQSYGDVAYGGGGDPADLARIGQQFLKEPANSGSPERLLAMKALGLGGGGAGLLGLALNPAAIPGAVAAGAGTLAAGRVAGSILRSDALANQLIRAGQGTAVNQGATPAANLLLRSVPPAFTPVAGPLPAQNENLLTAPGPLAITVRGASPR